LRRSLPNASRLTSIKPAGGGGYYLQGDVSRLYFNVENQRRRTTDAPRSYSNRILFFGGSTVFGQEVPDEFAIASCLRRISP
jgi:hypothetical protein